MSENEKSSLFRQKKVKNQYVEGLLRGLHKGAGIGGTDVIVDGEFVPIFDADEFAKTLPQTVIKKDTWGYYFAAIDIENKVIYLSEQQGEKAAAKPVIIPTEAQASDFKKDSFDYPIEWQAGDPIGVVNNFEYSPNVVFERDGKCVFGNAAVTSIEGNAIHYTGDIGFTSIYSLSTWDSKDYSVYNAKNPTLGAVKLTGDVYSIGPDHKTQIGMAGFIAGRGNSVLGSYGVALGRALTAGYGAFAANMNNKALGARSAVFGDSNEANAFASFAEGQGTKTSKNVIAQHVQGRYNKIDEEGRFADIVGWGRKVYRNGKWEEERKNIYTLTGGTGYLDATGGDAWFRGSVRVGGDSDLDPNSKLLATEERAAELAEEITNSSLIAANIRAEGQTPGTTCPIAAANIGESRSNKLFAFPANHIKLHALIDDVWTEVNDPNFYKLFTNGMQAYTGSSGATTWRPFDNATNYLGADSAVPTAWRITLTNPVRSQGGDRYVHLNAACIRIQGTPQNNSVDLRVVGRQQKGTEVTYIQSFALSGSPSYNTSYFDNGAGAAFGGWTPSTTSTNLDTLYIYLTRDTSKTLNKNFAIDQIHFFGRLSYVTNLNMVNHDHAYTVGSNGKDVTFQGKIQAQPATANDQAVTLGQMNKAISDSSSSAEVQDLLERVTNLEQGISPYPFYTDDTVAYEKSVPTDAFPYARIDIVGGMSYKQLDPSSTNLFDPYVIAQDMGLTVENGVISVNGYATSKKTVGELFPFLEVGKTYTISYDVNGEWITSNRMTSIVIGYNMPPDLGSPQMFQVTEETLHEPVWFYMLEWGYNEENGLEDYVPCNGTFSNIMLNEGGDYDEDGFPVPNVLPYEPPVYTSAATKVTALEVTGKNLIPPLTSERQNGVTLTVDENGVCTLNGTASEYAWFSVPFYVPFAGTYTLRDFGEGVFPSKGDDGYTLSTRSWVRQDGIARMQISPSGDISRATGTIPNASLPCEFVIYVSKGYTYTNCILRPMLVHSDVASTEYAPYCKYTLPIPPEVQALEGYGEGKDETAYNYIKWNENESVSYVRKVDDNLNVISPIITDVTEYFVRDNLVKVEGGGRIVFENERGDAVPSSVRYQLKTMEV